MPFTAFTLPAWLLNCFASACLLAACYDRLVPTLMNGTGLDVLEEMLASGGTRARAALAAEGAVGALARLLPMKGIGQRAAQV